MLWYRPLEQPTLADTIRLKTMKITNNYLNIICLGSFNPSILTPSFLKDVCEFKFDVEPSGQTLPVAANIKYGNIDFFVELEKLQIREDLPQDYKSSKIVEYFEKYLSVLTYTPIFVCGINFNSTISDLKLDAFLSNIKDRKKILALLKADKVVVDTKEVAKKDEPETWLSSNLTDTLEPNTLFRLNLKKEKDTVVVNLNYEIRTLEQDRKKAHVIHTNFLSLIEENQRLLSCFLT